MKDLEVGVGGIGLDMGRVEVGVIMMGILQVLFGVSVGGGDGGYIVGGVIILLDGEKGSGMGVEIDNILIGVILIDIIVIVIFCFFFSFLFLNILFCY